MDILIALLDLFSSLVAKNLMMVLFVKDEPSLRSIGLGMGPRARHLISGTQSHAIAIKVNHTRPTQGSSERTAIEVVSAISGGLIGTAADYIMIIMIMKVIIIMIIIILLVVLSLLLLQSLFSILSLLLS